LFVIIYLYIYIYTVHRSYSVVQLKMLLVHMALYFDKKNAIASNQSYKVETLSREISSSG
jgi:hypothetical protein